MESLLRRSRPTIIDTGVWYAAIMPQDEIKMLLA
jgi:hypothetical protein